MGECKFTHEPNEDYWCDTHQRAALECAIEDRDRYKAALEKMTKMPWGVFRKWRDIAEEALRSSEIKDKTNGQ